MVLVAARTCVLHFHNDAIALATNAIITASICDLNQTTAVFGLILALHPVVSKGYDQGGIGVLEATRAVAAQLLIYCPDAVMTGLVRLGPRIE